MGVAAVDRRVEERAAIDAALRTQRSTLLAFGALEIVTAIVSLYLAYVAIGSNWLDFAAQLYILLGAAALLLWLYLDPTESFYRPVLIIGMSVGAAFLLRLFAAIYGRAGAGDFDALLPPILGYTPIAVVFIFAIAPRELAVRLGALFVIVCAAGMLGFLSLRGGDLLQSPRMLEATQEFLLVNPLVMLLMCVATEVQSRLVEERLARSERRAPPPASARDRDPVTMTWNRRGFRAQLQQWCEDGMREGREVVVALADVEGVTASDPYETYDEDREARASVQRLREAFGDNALIARLTAHRYALAWFGRPLDELIDVACEFVEAGEPGAEGLPGARIGLAAFRPGEPINATMQRCDEQLRATSHHAVGVGFDSHDLI